MRVWRNDAQDDGSLHCLGNGRICAYGQGPNLVQVFGPPYSAPFFYDLALDMSQPIEVHSTREPGAAVWAHRVGNGSETFAEMLDFVDATLPCFVRRIHTRAPLRFRLGLVQPVEVVDNTARLKPSGAAGSHLLIAPAGRPVFFDYPFRSPINHDFAWYGPATIGQGASEDALFIACEPGEVVLHFAGGPSYPECIETIETALSTPYEEMLTRTRQWWQGHANHRAFLQTALPANTPLREQLLAAVDDVAVLIKVQQAHEGAVLAGHPYHLGYVRDQYGVSRGLLAMGHLADAKQILSFYWNVWQRHGTIRNAQGIGIDGLFHVHENDDVEITGYLIYQGFDYAERSGDLTFLSEITPMLEWAWEVQKRHLVDGMLPFNGDETYVADGILPRSALNDGSAEATMLFIEAGQKLLDYVVQTDRWPEERVRENREVLARVRNSFLDNFWDGKRLITNNPERSKRAVLPRFRHGVCEGCSRFGWTEQNDAQRYLCPKCLSTKDVAAADATIYTLQSVSLTPFYFASQLAPREPLETMVRGIVQKYESTGKLPSRPDQDHAVGYDYGLLLYALTEMNDPAAQALYEKTLAIVDSTGAWSEYYREHRPIGSRCRPWESAINIEALLRFAQSNTASEPAPL